MEIGIEFVWKQKSDCVHFLFQVTVIGDGLSDPVILAGDKLSNRAELIKAGAELAMPGAIKDTQETLGSKVFE